MCWVDNAIVTKDEELVPKNVIFYAFFFGGGG